MLELPSCNDRLRFSLVLSDSLSYALRISGNTIEMIRGVDTLWVLFLFFFFLRMSVHSAPPAHRATAVLPQSRRAAVFFVLVFFFCWFPVPEVRAFRAGRFMCVCSAAFGLKNVVERPIRKN